METVFAVVLGGGVKERHSIIFMCLDLIIGLLTSQTFLSVSPHPQTECWNVSHCSMEKFVNSEEFYNNKSMGLNLRKNDMFIEILVGSSFSYYSISLNKI